MKIQDLDDSGWIAAARRFLDMQEVIADAFRKATSGQLEDVEPLERIQKYVQREWEHWTGDAPGTAGPLPPRTADLGVERVVGATNDLLSIEFLEAGRRAADAVGRITVGGMPMGSGFLIGNGLVITNEHVLEDPDMADAGTLELNYEANRFGPLRRLESFTLNPDRFFLADKAHDFAVVAASQKSDNGTPLSDFGYHPLIGREGKILVGQPVNIVQHPDGREKAICLHDSRFMYLENDGAVDIYCWYSADTEPGSSGSPVFNNRWEVVALHHRAIPKMTADGEILDRNNRRISEERARERPEDVQWVANEGIRASRLVRALRAAQLTPPMDAERQALLTLWERADGPAAEGTPAAAAPSALRATEFESAPERKVADSVAADHGKTPGRESTDVRIASPASPPITITIRIGDG
jgi:endonuclease G